MLKQGYAATSMGKICGDVGVARGALFHHFPSKEDLPHQVLGRWIDKKLTPASFAIDPHLESDPLKRLRRFFAAVVDQYSSRDPTVCVAAIQGARLLTRVSTEKINSKLSWKNSGDASRSFIRKPSLGTNPAGN